MKRVFFRKALSVVLCLSFILSMMTPLSCLFALTGSAATDANQATSSETIYLDGVYYYIEKSVSYIGIIEVKRECRETSCRNVAGIEPPVA